MGGKLTTPLHVPGRPRTDGQPGGNDIHHPIQSDAIVKRVDNQTEEKFWKTMTAAELFM